MNKIKISKDSHIIVDSSKDQTKLKMSIQLRGAEGKIYIASFDLDKDQVDSLISNLVSARNKIIHV